MAIIEEESDNKKDLNIVKKFVEFLTNIPQAGDGHSDFSLRYMNPYRYSGYYYYEGGEYGELGWYSAPPDPPFDNVFSGRADKDFESEAFVYFNTALEYNRVIKERNLDGSYVNRPPYRSIVDQ